MILSRLVSDAFVLKSVQILNRVVYSSRNLLTHRTRYGKCDFTK